MNQFSFKPNEESPQTAISQGYSYRYISHKTIINNFTLPIQIQARKKKDPVNICIGEKERKKTPKH